MARRPPPPKPPDFPPEKTHAALKKQLDALDSLRRQSHRSAENDEREWKNLTMNIFIHGFGEDSPNVTQLRSANLVGGYFHPGMSEGERQQNFLNRIEAYAATLRSSLAELKLLIPESEIAGSYEVGDAYQFYRDLKTIVGFATRELFIIDNYLDIQIFDIYMDNLIPSLAVKVLSNKVGDALRLVAEKFVQRGRFELRSSNDVHDRVVFADERCWVIGQSIKDATQKKPTYIVEHSGTATMKNIYEQIWANANVVVKG
jgi:hypothetical protein